MQPLPNYIRTYRRRAGLSQEELAYLLGSESGATISRHETGSRLPPLAAALAYEFILGASVKDIFAGTVEMLQQSISERAESLSRNLGESELTPETQAKLETLGNLILGDLEDAKYIPVCE